jgi:hypothetical protein
LLKSERHKNGPPLANSDAAGSAAIIFVCSIIGILLAITTAVVVIRMRAQEKVRIIETAHIEEDADKSPIMEEVGFEEAFLEDVELL